MTYSTTTNNPKTTIAQAIDGNHADDDSARAISPASAAKLVEFIKKRDPVDEGAVDYGDVEFKHRSTRIGQDHPEPVIQKLALLMRSLEVENCGAEENEQFPQMREELLSAIADPDAYAAENWEKIDWRIRDRKIEIAKTIAAAAERTAAAQRAEIRAADDDVYYSMVIENAETVIEYGLRAWSVLEAGIRPYEIGPSILRYLGRTRVNGRIQPRASVSPE